MYPSHKSIEHFSVLLSDFKKIFPEINGIWVDGTFGFGGYTDYLLEAGAKKIIVIDLDPDVKKYADRIKRKWPQKIDYYSSNFVEIENIVKKMGIQNIDGVLLDIGVSSMQLDQSVRGFSFKNDGPLDMRMSKIGPSASDFINNAEESLISEVIFKYGEEKKAKIIARRIVEIRKKIKIDTTYKLSKIIEEVFGFNFGHRIHPATKSFQAIRILINNELNNLIFGLLSSYQVLKVGGFFAIITFHSLEDRIVKRFFNLLYKINNPLNEIKKVGGESIPIFEKINKKPIIASGSEIKQNPRSRSAKLRVVRKLSDKSLNVDPKKLGLPQVSNSLREFQCE
tara:strand:- start:615 stop:1631 length:1017 start_codon:yes stop_codon:yes gene_type:complete